VNGEVLDAQQEKDREIPNGNGMCLANRNGEQLGKWQCKKVLNGNGERFTNGSGELFMNGSQTNRHCELVSSS
jgi:hypothetical protein